MSFLDFIRPYVYLFGGKVEMLNLLFLVSISFIVCLQIAGKRLRFGLSILLSVVISAQVVSLFFVQTFIGYQFFVHCNVRDVLSTFSLYLSELVLLFVFQTLLTLLFFYSQLLYSFMVKPIVNRFAPYVFKALLGTFLLMGFCAFSIERGCVRNLYELSELLITNSDSFEENLANLEFKNYTTSSKIKATSGKNVIVLSLESFEKGYLSDSLSELTPNLTSLRSNWNYYEMNQNHGSQWTSGSLYTSLTGLPAFFGSEGNQIFQSAYHANISSLGHIFNLLGYRSSFLIGDAKFSGTQALLNTMQFHEVIDRNTLKMDHARDYDLFDQAKKVVDRNSKEEKPFFMFLSTMDTHFPEGIYDSRMEKYVPKRSSNMKFMVSAVDYMVQDFIAYLESKNYLENTVVYIYPDHLKMGDPSIFEGTGERGLYLITNASKSVVAYKDTLDQVDIPNVILNGAEIKHNVKFLADYVTEDRDKFIRENASKLTALNSSGIQRIGHDEIKELKLSDSFEEYSKDTTRFIAHAGGRIDGFTYTNSLEALDLFYSKGFRLFELDILETSDGKFVAVHDWKSWNRHFSFDEGYVPSKEVFMNHSKYDRFTPLSMVEINSWFEKHKDAILVTDKINQPKRFASEFVDKNRLMMELFTYDAVQQGLECGILSAMPSQHIVNELKEDGVEKFVELGIKDIAISRRYIADNVEFLDELKRNNIRAYVFHLNFADRITEDFVVRYEMDHIYGIYADEWDFAKEM